jgi:hypothetical protein
MYVLMEWGIEELLVHKGLTFFKSLNEYLLEKIVK